MKASFAHAVIVIFHKCIIRLKTHTSENGRVLHLRLGFYWTFNNIYNAVEKDADSGGGVEGCVCVWGGVISFPLHPHRGAGSQTSAKHKSLFDLENSPLSRASPAHEVSQYGMSALLCR